MPVKMFEKQTAPLNDKEVRLLPFIIEGLKKRKGKDNAIKSKEICRIINLRTQVKTTREALGYPEYKLTGERLRKLINHIRRHDLLSWVIASQEGYYVSDDITEALEEADSLEDRANAILSASRAIRESVKRRATGNQGQLF